MRVLGQPFGQLGLVGIAEFIGDLFAVRLHGNRTVIFGSHLGEGKLCQLQSDRVLEGDEGLQSGYIHPEANLPLPTCAGLFRSVPVVHTRCRLTTASRSMGSPITDKGKKTDRQKRLTKLISFFMVVILLYVSVDKDKRLPPSLSLQF